jgi:hypothetical protein
VWKTETFNIKIIFCIKMPEITYKLTSQFDLLETLYEVQRCNYESLQNYIDAINELLEDIEEFVEVKYDNISWDEVFSKKVNIQEVQEVMAQLEITYDLMAKEFNKQHKDFMGNLPYRIKCPMIR